MADYHSRILVKRGAITKINHLSGVLSGDGGGYSDSDSANPKLSSSDRSFMR